MLVFFSNPKFFIVIVFIRKIYYLPVHNKINKRNPKQGTRNRIMDVPELARCELRSCAKS